MADKNKTPRLKEYYKNVVIPKFIKEYGYKNTNAVPKFEKIVLNAGLGDVKDNKNSFAKAIKELEIISGQKPLVIGAKKSVSNFKLRQGMKVAAKVTIRGDRMYEFFDRLVSVAIPRVRDFDGLSLKSFDGRGNYAFGVKEQLTFPEISYDDIDKIRGFDVMIVTSAKNDVEAIKFLREMGLPLKKEKENLEG